MNQKKLLTPFLQPQDGRGKNYTPRVPKAFGTRDVPNVY